jgi:hypothetical protein
LRCGVCTLRRLPSRRFRALALKIEPFARRTFNAPIAPRGWLGWSGIQHFFHLTDEFVLMRDTLTKRK